MMRAGYETLDEARERARREEAARSYRAGQDTPGPNGQADPGSRINLTNIRELSINTDRPYLVKGLIPYPGLAVIWGPPGCGKSFWTFDVDLHVAMGWPYRGKQVRQGPVIYCAFEGGNGVPARFAAACHNYGIAADAPVPITAQTLTIDLVKDHGALIAGIRQLLGEAPPVTVTLDTLNRSFSGSESSDADMTAYIRAADAIREAFGCTVKVVHHCGHNGERPRGHSSLLGARDALISVKRDALDNIVTVVDQMKDGPDGESTTSKLVQVTVGQDSDGDDITSCFVVETAPVEKPDRSGPKLTLAQQLYYEILCEAGPEGLTVEEWNEKAREEGVAGGQKQRLYECRLALKKKDLAYEYPPKSGHWKRTHS